VKILLGVTGGVAAFKAVLLLRRLQDAGAEVEVLMTESATRFVGEATFHALSGRPVNRSVWDLGKTPRGERHVELSRWADAMVVYPATAHSVGALASGSCDDLIQLTAFCMEGPVLMCPAMHHRMAARPQYRAAVDTLGASGVHVLPPTTGRLASGEIGEGRLPEPHEAIEALRRLLTPQDLRGRTVLVTGGPTREHIDPVRFISNPSTGKMGASLAQVAARRGAEVTFIRGPGTASAPLGVAIVDVRSAQEKAAAVQARSGGADLLVMAAAVADFRPVAPSDHKIKKGGAEGGPLEIEFERTTDILASLVGDLRPRVVVGFAMETKGLVESARAKLEAKDLDLIVANDLTTPGAGFGTDTNVVVLLDREGGREDLPRLSKEAVASRVLDRVAARLQ
jgi:phosphopantothenoylcysteine decarboxylase/phosphopantothenate--cysteine ligase